MIQDDDGQFAPGTATQLTLSPEAFDMLRVLAVYNDRFPFRECEHIIALSYKALLEAGEDVNDEFKEAAEAIVGKSEA